MMKVLLFGAFALLISVTFVTASIDCHYCGLRKLCGLPYAEDESERITCAKSCMKFDGYSEMDNKRVIVRGCGEIDINKCEKNAAWFGAKGNLCLCNGFECNSSVKMAPNFVAGGLAAIIVAIVKYFCFVK
jgi:hypothetical protein